MGDSDNVWSMRFPGGMYVSCPRVITGDEVGIFRCAWLLLEEDGEPTSSSVKSLGQETNIPSRKYMDSILSESSIGRPLEEDDDNNGDLSMDTENSSTSTDNIFKKKKKTDIACTSNLARVEASVFALQPLVNPDTNEVVGFQPPSLGSLRCDVLTNIGELENASRLSELMTL